MISLARHGKNLGVSKDTITDFTTQYPGNVRSTLDYMRFSYEMMYTFLVELVDADEDT